MSLPPFLGNVIAFLLVLMVPRTCCLRSKNQPGDPTTEDLFAALETEAAEENEKE
jgi:hypothetical protein